MALGDIQAPEVQIPREIIQSWGLFLATSYWWWMV
jgi:hypothetical protein